MQHKVIVEHPQYLASLSAGGFLHFIAEEMESQPVRQSCSKRPSWKVMEPSLLSHLGEHSLPRSCLVRTLKPKWEGIFSGLFQRLCHMKEKRRKRTPSLVNHKTEFSILYKMKSLFFPSKNNFWLILRLVASFCPVNTKFIF